MTLEDTKTNDAVQSCDSSQYTHIIQEENWDILTKDWDPLESGRLITLYPQTTAMGTDDTSWPLRHTQAIVLLFQSDIWMLAETVIAVLEQNLCHIFGYPIRFHSDQGISFIIQVRQQTGIFLWKCTFHAHYHQHANGSTE